MKKREQIKSLIYVNCVEISVFFISLFVYVFTSSRSIVDGDTGDFLSAAATGGVPHEPGYPLHSIISRIAFLLPFGNPVWQANLVSAVLASMALVFTFKIVRGITDSRPAALFAALALGTYESFWFYALVSQIHILQVLILAALFFCLTKFIKTKKLSYFYLAGLTFGLGVSNNHTIILSFPSILITLLYARREFTFVKLLKTTGYMLIGLLPYIYLFIAARTNSPTSWGGIHDLKSFVFFFLRGDYGTTNWARPQPWAPFKFSPFVYFFTSIFKTSWYVLPFFFISFYYFWKRSVTYVVLFIGLLLTGPLFYLLMIAPVRDITHEANTAQFLPYSFFFISILAGLSVDVVLHKIKISQELLISLFITAIFIPVFLYNLPKVRQDNNFLTRETSKFVLSEMPQNAVLLTFADTVHFPSLYWQYDEKYRQDVAVIQLGLLGTAWYKNALLLKYQSLSDVLKDTDLDYEQVCEKYAGENKLFISPYYPEFDELFKDKCKIIPYGLVAQIVPKDKAISVDEVKKYEDSEWKKYNAITQPTLFKDDYLRTRETLFFLGEHFNFSGIFYLTSNKEDWAMQRFRLAREVSPDEASSEIGESTLLFKNNDFSEATKILKDGIQRNPSLPQLYKNLGLIYAKQGDIDSAYIYIKEYLNFKLEDDPDVPGFKDAVHSYESRKLLQ